MRPQTSHRPKRVSSVCMKCFCNRLMRHLKYYNKSNIYHMHETPFLLQGCGNPSRLWQERPDLGAARCLLVVYACGDSQVQLDDALSVRLEINLWRRRGGSTDWTRLQKVRKWKTATINIILLLYRFVEIRSPTRGHFLINIKHFLPLNNHLTFRC